MRAELSRGDHIRVGRLGYWHHGIYISDNRVIQFGANIWQKRNATIQAVTLAEFANGSRVYRVDHPLALPAQDDFGVTTRLDQAVYRAEMLLEFHPEGKYNLLGRNCEHIATFCITGYSDSVQVRQYLATGGIIVGVLAIDYWGSKRSSTWMQWTMAVLTLLVSIGAIEHHIETTRFRQELTDFFQLGDTQAN